MSDKRKRYTVDDTGQVEDFAFSVVDHRKNSHAFATNSKEEAQARADKWNSEEDKKYH